MTYAEINETALYIYSEDGMDTGIGTKADVARMIADGIVSADQLSFRVA